MLDLMHCVLYRKTVLAKRGTKWPKYKELKQSLLVRYFMYVNTSNRAHHVIVQKLIRTNNQETTNALHHWPFELGIH